MNQFLQCVVPIGVVDIQPFIPSFFNQEEYKDRTMTFIDTVIYTSPYFIKYQNENEFIYFDALQDRLFENFSPTQVSEQYDEMIMAAENIGILYSPWIDHIVSNHPNMEYGACIIKRLHSHHTQIELVPDVG